MFINGVTIILTGSKDEIEGMTISWVTQIEKDHLIISAPRNAKATKALLSNKVFTVSVLGQGQEDIARWYGGSKSKKTDFNDSNIIEYLPSGLPAIKKCCSNIICKFISENEVAEQIVVTAKIKEINATFGCKPLIYDKSSYFN